MKNVTNKKLFFVTLTVILLILVVIVYIITYSFYHTHEVSTNDTNQSSNERKKYKETQSYNGLYKFLLSDDNGNGYTFDAYGIIQFNGEDCKIKYTKNKTSDLTETNILNGTCGLYEEDNSNFYFSIYAGSQNKEICTYKCSKLESNLVCELISDYNLAGCSSNKKLNLILINEHQDIYSAFTEIEKQEKEKEDAAEKAKKEQEEQNFKISCKEYTYEQIARNPDNFKGTNVKLTGKVIQVMADNYSTNLRVNITKKGSYSTYYTDTVYVVYYPKSGEDKILEDDIITIYGTSKGDCSYDTIMGTTVTLPNIQAKYITINN